MSHLRLLGIGVALAAGIAAILLAGDVGAWQGKLDDATARYQASAPAPAGLTPATVLPAGLSGSLLRVGHDRAWLRALQEFARVEQATKKLRVLAPGSYAALKRGQAVLLPETRSSNPQEASRAYVLLAALTFREALPGNGVVASLAQSSLDDLENAVRLDPGNETAREDIEQVLRYITEAIPPDQRQSRGVGRKANLSPKGGYAGPPGKGY